MTTDQGEVHRGQATPILALAAAPRVFRTGDHRPPDSGTDLDRIILYVPARILDLAEALAEKAGVPTVQDYCALLLMQAPGERARPAESGRLRGQARPARGFEADRRRSRLSRGVARAVRCQGRDAEHIRADQR